MKTIFTPRRFLFLTFFLAASLTSLADTTLIKFGSAWQYLDNGTNQGSTWRTGAVGWPSGNGALGYGDEERTTVSYGGNPAAKYITTYFRYTVNIPSVAAYASFRMNMYVDDGAVVYINGTQRAITNIGAGPIFTTLATAAAAEDGHAVQSFTVTGLVNGNNEIAVEVHQSAANSSDLVFDLELVGVTASAEPAITRGPYLQMVSPTAVSIRWQTGTTSTTSRIKYGTAENSLTTTASDGTLLADHEMRITGLTPDTKYYYAIGSATSIIKGSYRNYFTTSPPANTTRKIRIGVFGDPGIGGSVQKGTRDAYMQLKSNYNNSELAIMLGDNAYNGGLDAEHQTGFFNIYNDNILNNHVLFPVPGNHEYNNNGTLAANHAIPYYSIFTVPTAAESGGTVSGTEHYYSFDYGNIHFIMLDSYGIDGGNHLYDDTTAGVQAVWLKADLAANAGTHKWTVVCLHHPPYTNGTHLSNSEGDLVAIRQKITPILERYGVDVVLTGHSHVYERSFLVKDHTGLSTPFNTAAVGAGTKISSSNARYDGVVPSGVATTDTSVATSSCPYFTIDSVYKHGTVYVVAGSAGQIGASGASTYPVFYTRNQSTSAGGEAGALFLEVQDNRLDAKFVGSSGTVRDQFTIMKGVNKKTVISSVVNTTVNMNASWLGGYNWYTVPATTTSTARMLSVTPSSTGTYTYYVNDSLSPDITCIADTFQLQITSTLAVTINKYNVALKNNKVLVQWTTQQEVNSDYFTIERSADGLNYEMVMVISGKGNSDTPTDYEFVDNNPLEGTSYYRLVATDKNGDAKIAGVRAVNYRMNKSFTLTVSPNPAVNNQINSIIESTKKQTLKIKAFTLNGAEVYNTSFQANTGNNTLKFNLKSGNYVLSIEGLDGKINEKIIVK
jgi:acid phosphatase type 7